jgi:hypothetical protein
MPTITPSNALICAADYLTDTIMGLIPTPTCMQDAVNQLMVIFKQQACTANDAAIAQRVLREQAQAERLIEEERQILAQAQVTPLPSFEIKENNNTTHTLTNASHKSRRTKMTHPHLQTRDSNDKQGPSRRTSCYNAWKY